MKRKRIVMIMIMMIMIVMMIKNRQYQTHNPKKKKIEDNLNYSSRIIDLGRIAVPPCGLGTIT